jgi:hypothetical protein
MAPWWQDSHQRTASGFNALQLARLRSGVGRRHAIAPPEHLGEMRRIAKSAIGGDGLDGLMRQAQVDQHTVRAL